MNKYILGIDQSTSGTKAILFDEAGAIIGRSDLPHEQKISEQGWVSHDPMEIYRNVLAAAKNVVEQTGVPKEEIAAVGISNQRETALVWDRVTGLPIGDAVVWQCGRAADICDRISVHADTVREKTGLPLSPYFSAAKIAWILESTNATGGKNFCAGTIDSWLLFKLTNDKSFKTDYSNASRTQLFNIQTLKWDTDICALFGVNPDMLAEVCDSNSHFGDTDLEGYLPKPVPICGVLGDSHGALFGQGCVSPGMVKATYGTGSSVMLNIGEEPVFSKNGLVTSLAWCMDGTVNYVLEGNINYTGSVTKWLVDDLQLLSSSKEAGRVAKQADPQDTTYLIPAFTGLGAPYWNSDVKAMFYGMNRKTGRAELVKAAEECIAYQIADIVNIMKEDTQMDIQELRVDGGPTRDSFLMQFQSDILDLSLSVPYNEELSAIGAAYTAGIKAGIYKKEILSKLMRREYRSAMNASVRQKKYGGWKDAVKKLLS